MGGAVSFINIGGTTTTSSSLSVSVSLSGLIASGELFESVGVNDLSSVVGLFVVPASMLDSEEGALV